MPDLEAEKKVAAEEALNLVEDGMTLGLGTGSTVAYFLDGLSHRISMGLKIKGVPTSRRTEETARKLGIPLADRWDSIDMDVDGADVIDSAGNMIKGGGGALLREKIVAHSSKKVVIICDSSKYTEKIHEVTVPVEIATFGAETTARKIEAAGCSVTFRNSGDYRTDNGNMILDCRFKELTDPEAIDAKLHRIPGVVETGIFIGLADKLILAEGKLVRTIDFKKKRDL